MVPKYLLRSEKLLFWMNMPIVWIISELHVKNGTSRKHAQRGCTFIPKSRAEISKRIYETNQKDKTSISIVKTCYYRNVYEKWTNNY